MDYRLAVLARATQKNIDCVGLFKRHAQSPAVRPNDAARRPIAGRFNAGRRRDRAVAFCARCGAANFAQQHKAELATAREELSDANAELERLQSQDGAIPAAEAEQLRARISELEAQLAQKPPSRDVFTTINGIGPAFQKRLYDAGVCTFAELAQQTPERLRQIVSANNKQRIKPEAWIAEAQRRAQASCQGAERVVADMHDNQQPGTAPVPGERVRRLVGWHGYDWMKAAVALVLAALLLYGNAAGMSDGQPVTATPTSGMAIAQATKAARIRRAYSDSNDGTERCANCNSRKHGSPKPDG